MDDCLDLGREIHVRSVLESLVPLWPWDFAFRERYPSRAQNNFEINLLPTPELLVSADQLLPF